MNLSDQQLLRILECLGLRVQQLEAKRGQIDHEIEDEVHELRGIMNTFALELQLRRMKQCP